ncbi:hypothetical protein UY3_05726 [Chelonia mydas]|uniref:Uncharacterized protein n=1 Tax=Chelonia mydas TaxID=8469 RepID=M7BN92_CHEMY|nr:hypothetical protein UY3_05726 [Chelonia mydas]
MVLPKFQPPSKLPPGAVWEATVPTGTIGPATMLGATAPAVAPAVRVGWPGPSKDGYERRLGWHKSCCCLWTRRSGDATISTFRTGADGNRCSVNGLNRQTCNCKVPAIDARGCDVLAETWSGTPRGNGTDDHAVTDCGTLSETRTVGNAHRGPINICSLRMSGAESPGRTKLSQTVWSASRAIHMDSDPRGRWVVNGVGNVPLTETSTEQEVTAEIPAAACLWSMGLT